MSDKVRASSENRGNLARYAADGNLSTFWSPARPRCGKGCETVPTFHWLEIDLGRIETVHAVTLRSAVGCLVEDAGHYEYDFLR